MTPNLHELSDDQIDMAVAEMMEPSSGLPLIDQHTKENVDVSPKQFWVLCTRPDWHWKPFQRWSTDWSACGVLLEQFIKPSFYREDGLWFVFPNGILTRENQSIFVSVNNPSLKRAICEAWLLANGGEPHA